MTTINFVSSMTHAKCNEMLYVLDGEQSDNDDDDEDSSPPVVPEPPVATANEAHKSLAHALTWLETQN